MQSYSAFGLRAAVCAVALGSLAACQTGSPFPDPLARMNPDMQAVVMQYQQSGARPVSTLTVTQARSQPNLMDAARAVESAQLARRPGQGAYVKTTDMSVAGAAGPVSARLYDPAPGHHGQPIVLYFHGGGGVTGTLDTGDASARALATQAHAMVLSVAYRLAPEAPFPAQMDDGVAAYRWLMDNAATLGADSRRIALAGESVGGTIAIDTAIEARDAHMRMPVHLVLIEPVVSPDLHTRSEIANQYDVPFSRADETWMFQNWVAQPADLYDPRIDLLNRADVHGLPTTTVISSEMDPLDDDGYVIAQKLQTAGVDTSRIEYQGTANGFFGMGTVVARSNEAEAFVAQALNATFTRIGAPRAERGNVYRHRTRVRHLRWHPPKGS